MHHLTVIMILISYLWFILLLFNNFLIKKKDKRKFEDNLTEDVNGMNYLIENSKKNKHSLI